LFTGERVPTLYTSTFTNSERDRLCRWLEKQGHAPTLLVFPKLKVELLDDLRNYRPPSAERTRIIGRSAGERFGAVAEAVAWADRDCGLSRWGGLVLYLHMHCCAIRRPKEHLLALLHTKLFSSERDFMAAVIPAENLPRETVIPTATMFSRKDEAAQRRKEVAEILRSIGSGPDDYLTSLGAGDFSSEWAQSDDLVTEPRACILDTGADESHITLQGKVLVHAMFDSLGQFKHARDCVDHGCHGTKIASIIGGHTVNGNELVRTHPFPLRLGVCPAARLSVVSIARGTPLDERCSLSDVLAGMDWAIANKDHPAWGRYEVVNISMEIASRFFEQEARQKVDSLAEELLYNGLLPVFASGNEGAGLATMGCVVGSMDRDGKHVSKDDKSIHLFAPGEKRLCCQPPVDELANDVLSCYSGSSFAAAFAAGTLIQLAAKTGKSAFQCFEALIATAEPGKMIRPEKAFRHLCGW